MGRSAKKKYVGKFPVELTEYMYWVKLVDIITTQGGLGTYGVDWTEEQEKPGSNRYMIRTSGKYAAAVTGNKKDGGLNELLDSKGYENPFGDMEEGLEGGRIERRRRNRRLGFNREDYEKLCEGIRI